MGGGGLGVRQNHKMGGMGGGSRPGTQSMQNHRHINSNTVSLSNKKTPRMVGSLNDCIEYLRQQSAL